MRLFTFDTNHNPGRSNAWSVRSEAIKLADHGASGLAGLILRDGFSPFPACAVPFVRNEEKATLASLCAEIVAGLSERKSDGGGIKPIINGTPMVLFQSRLAQIADKKAAGIVVDGRRRCIASIIAYGCGLETIEMQGTELTPEQAANVEAAFIINAQQELAQKLDPWAKVEAGERCLASSATMNESELMARLGVKRGDGQLIHRAASAIRKHGLTPDRSARCPSKEEWKAIGDCVTREEARDMLISLQTGTRDKALGWDMVRNSLATMSETATLNARKLAECKDRKSLDAYLATIVQG